MPARTLVLVRHGKSDWSGDHPDRDRPLSPRGRRQTSEAGRWLSSHGPPLDLAIVSPAARAVQTWDRIAAELADPPSVRVVEAAYAFDGDALLPLVRDVTGAVALVGHNPAVEELLKLLTGEDHRMPTSSLAVVDLDQGRLLHHGRPPA